MSEDTLLKICALCQQPFPNTAEYFYKRSTGHASRTDPFRPVCKRCHQLKQQSYRRDTCVHCEVSLNTGQRQQYCSTRCKVLYKMGGIGAVYGRLTILDYVGTRKQSYVRCLCVCGKEREVPIHSLKKGLTLSCGCLHRDRMLERGMEQHPLWKGGRTINNRGYVLVKKPGHPNAYKSAGGIGYVLEHVFVMSEFLGRPLRKGETVHHRNGVKTDNRLENLELWTVHQPYGQRVEDVLAWCRAYIAQYEADAEKLKAL